MKNIVPFDDHVLVRREIPGDITNFGLVLPEIAIGVPYQGEVLAVGRGKYYDALGVHISIDVEVGDTVVFPMYAGKAFEVDGEELLLLSSKDVLAVRLSYP